MLAIIDRSEVSIVYFAIPLGESKLIEDMYFQLLDRNVAVHWVLDIFPMLLVNCRIPDDCIDSRRYPLFMARAAMRGLVQDLTHATGELP